MKKTLNECCNCSVPGYPCNPTCQLKAVEHFYCDKCHEETKLYEYDGGEYCIECIEKMLDVVEGSDI
jgi:hypothetical protein